MPSNCPAIAQGYSKQCRDIQGGVLKFYITEHANIDQDTYVEASGVVTTLNLTAGKYFWEYEQELNTATYNDDPAPQDSGSTFWEQGFNCTLHKRSATISYSLRALAHQDVAIIVVEQSGTMFLLGRKNGMKLKPSKSGPGTNMGDKNGYDLVFGGQEPVGAPTVSTSILNALIQ